MNEYFTWIEEGQTIVKHMNDGEVTPQDFAEKMTFWICRFSGRPSC